jgi:uncharacterized protein DUF6194
MSESSIVDYITNTFRGAESVCASGYTLFFYGVDRKLPFATIASSDNAHDSVSNLDRPGIFRLNMGVTKQTFQSLFGADPVGTDDYDYTALDQFMPHPDYAAWHFVSILNPGELSMARVKRFLAEAYHIARSRARSAAPPE